MKQENQVINELSLERAALTEKLDRLNEFIGSDRFELLTGDHRGMLEDQVVYMQGYSDTLAMRVEDLESQT